MKKVKKRKLRIKRLFLAFFVLFLIIFVIYNFFNAKITNIYIKGNYYLTDQEIIDLAKISDYPSRINAYISSNELDETTYIDSAKIKLKGSKMYIEVKENRPLFYSTYLDKTVLLDGQTVTENLSVPTLLNYVVDEVYQEFIIELGKIDIDILNRISEIEYKPNTDKYRFLLYMNDGNYVYVNTKTLYKMNTYLDFVKRFPNKTGVLYFDYGNNFEIIE